MLCHDFDIELYNVLVMYYEYILNNTFYNTLLTLDLALLLRKQNSFAYFCNFNLISLDVCLQISSIAELGLNVLVMH